MSDQFARFLGTDTAALLTNHILVLVLGGKLFLEDVMSPLVLEPPRTQMPHSSGRVAELGTGLHRKFGVVCPVHRDCALWLKFASTHLDVLT
jgi:hypothetical protein